MYAIILWMLLQTGRSLDELDHFYPGNTTCRGGNQRRGLTKNAKEAENRQQKWWNYTPEGLETLSVSKSKMENRWNEHMIKFEWVESLLVPRAAREAGLEEQKWTDCTRNFIPMQLRSFFIAISACFLTSDIHSSDASMLSIWDFLPANFVVGEGTISNVL